MGCLCSANADDPADRNAYETRRTGGGGQHYDGGGRVIGKRTSGGPQYSYSSSTGLQKVGGKGGGGGGGRSSGSRNFGGGKVGGTTNAYVNMSGSMNNLTEEEKEIQRRIRAEAAEKRFENEARRGNISEQRLQKIKEKEKADLEKMRRPPNDNQEFIQMLN